MRRELRRSTGGIASVRAVLGGRPGPRFFGGALGSFGGLPRFLGGLPGPRFIFTDGSTLSPGGTPGCGTSVSATSGPGVEAPPASTGACSTGSPPLRVPLPLALLEASPTSLPRCAPTAPSSALPGLVFSAAQGVSAAGAAPVAPELATAPLLPSTPASACALRPERGVFSTLGAGTGGAGVSPASPCFVFPAPLPVGGVPLATGVGPCFSCVAPSSTGRNQLGARTASGSWALSSRKAARRSAACLAALTR